MTVPDDIAEFYGERVNVLMVEVAALAENLNAARAARVEADTALKAAPAEFRAALTKAAREGAKKLPPDPIPELEATLAEADRRVAALVAAGRIVSGELADALDDDNEAAAKADTVAREAVAKVVPLIEQAVEAMEAADEAWTAAVWCDTPPFVSSQGHAGSVTGTLQQALKEAQRLGRVEA